MSTQRTMITRWPPYVWDRHAGRSRSTAGVLDAECGFPIVLHELPRDLQRYLAALDEPYCSLDFAAVAARATSPDVVALLQLIQTEPPTERIYRAAMAQREQMHRLFATGLACLDVAALVYPTVPILAPPLGDDDVTVVDGREVPVFATSIHNTSPGTLIGTPAVSLPCGRSRYGLPVGLSLEGPRRTDERLLQLARAVEQAISDDHGTTRGSRLSCRPRGASLLQAARSVVANPG